MYIKSNEILRVREYHLSFPIHHKHQREFKSSSDNQNDDIDSLDVQKLILDAYNEARNIVKHSQILDKLSQCGINSLHDIEGVSL